MKYYLKTVFVAALTIMLLSAVVLAKSGKFTEIVEAKERVKLTTISGDCVIEINNNKEIEITVEYDLDGRAEVEPKIRVSDNRVRLSEHVNVRNNYSGHIKWNLSVPEGTAVEFSTASGDLTLNNFKGEIEMSSASGDIELIGCSGEYDISTASGDYYLTDCNGEYELSTASGDIDLKNCNGEFDVSTASGDINAKNLILESDASLSAASGDIDVLLAESPQYDISLSTASGDSFLDFGGNKINGFIEMRAIHRKGEIDAPFEFDDVSYRELRGSDKHKEVIMTVTIGSDSPHIEISTASGVAEIKK